MPDKTIKKWEPDDFELEMTSVWSFPNRGNWATHDAKWRGNWSPYIPRNILLRYSSEGDMVLDQFAGGGTTLVEAKLSLILPAKPKYMVTMFPDSFSRSDCEFFMGDVVVHVPSFPGEAVIRSCQRNLDDGKRPILITTYKRVVVAESLADDKGIADRIDVFELEQFLASNLYELGLFALSGCKKTAAKLISIYNAIVDSCETDPSLKISLGGK